MSIRIEFAKDSKTPGTTAGVKIYTDEGVELKDVLAVDIRMRPNEVVTATVEILVSPDSKLENLTPLLGRETLQDMLRVYGYKIVPR